MRTTRAPLCLLAAVVGCLAGCAQWVYTSDDLRHASFASLAAVHVDGAPLGTYMRQRTAVIIHQIDLDGVRLHGDEVIMDLKPGGMHVGGLSHAVAIEHDGYFLTAAHVVNKGSMYMVFWDGNSAQVAMPRVVAQVRDDGAMLDYAVLHVDAAVPLVFDRAAQMQPGAAVAAVGCFDPVMLGNHILALTETSMGGTLAAQQDLKDHARASYHTIPLRLGDSGGPLADMSGGLLGINARIELRAFAKRKNVAIMPAQAWLEQVIAADRGHPHERHAPLAPRTDPPPKDGVSILVSLEENMVYHEGIGPRAVSASR